jgi:multiple sugar transport system substrate-binding protein
MGVQHYSAKGGKSVKRLWFLGLFVFVLLGVVGLAGAKTEIVYWSHTYDPAVSLTKEMIAEFEKQNPDIQITYDHVPHASFEPKLLTAFAGGTGPDVYWMGDWVMPKWMPSLTEPVDYTVWGVNSYEEFAQLYEPGALDAFTQDGVIYTGGISEYNTFSLYYNPQHFREAGIPLPSATVPLTWEEMAEIAAKLTKFDEKGGRVRSGFETVYGVPIWTILLLEPQIRQLGGELLDETGKPWLNHEKVVEAMKWWHKMRVEYKATDPGFQSPDLWADFAQGRVSMTIAGPWAISIIRSYNPDMEIGITPLPHFQGSDRVTTLYAWAWFVNPASKNKKEAWRFVHYLTSDPLRWWERVKYIQPKKGVLQKLLEGEPLLTTFLEDFKYAQYEFRSPNYYEISSILTRAFQQVVMEGIEPQEVLNKAQEEAEKL